MISVILIAIAAIFNGFMDSIFNMFSTSIFSDATRFNQNFWDPSKSWVNKWKNPEVAPADRVEKFLGANTFLVWITDAWHLFKMLFLTTIFAAVMLYTPFIAWYFYYPMICGVWGIMFELTLKILKK